MSKTNYGKIPPAAGLTEWLSSRARERRKTQRSLLEVERHARAMRNDLLPRLQLEYLPIDSIKPAGRRIRQREAAQEARLSSSIDRFGVLPIMVTGDRTIIDGHGIWEIARQKGLPTIPCVIADHLTPNEVRLLRVALNRLGETGRWDDDALRMEFEELIVLGDDLTDTGFAEAEIDGLLLVDEEAPGRDSGDAVPPLGELAVSQEGYLWSLDDHRLLQADCRDPRAHHRLMNGEAARLHLTDVPFNREVRALVATPHREFAMASGEMSSAAFAAFQRDWMKPAIAHLEDGGLLGTFIDWRSVEVVLAAGRELGLELLNLVVWAKSNGGQGSLWRSRHELLPMFKKGTAPHVNNVALGRHGRWRSNVWEYPGASSIGSEVRGELASHPTVKNRKMIEDALLDISNRGEIVVDSFAGSGTTIIAAENTGRRCRAIEIDGLFCDLIIKRWEAATGGTAILTTTGQTFAQLTEQQAGDPVADSPDARTQAPTPARS